MRTKKETLRPRERQVIESLLRVWSYRRSPPIVTEVRFEDELGKTLRPPPDGAFKVDGHEHFVEVTDCELFLNQATQEQHLTQFCFELRRGLAEFYSEEELTRWFPRYEKEPASYRTARFTAFLKIVVPEIRALIDAAKWPKKEWVVPRTKFTLRFSASPTGRTPWITCWSNFDYKTVDVMAARLAEKTAKMKKLVQHGAKNILVVDTQFCGYLSSDIAFREAFPKVKYAVKKDALNTFDDIYLSFNVEKEIYCLPLAIHHKASPVRVYGDWYRIQKHHLF